MFSCFEVNLRATSFACGGLRQTKVELGRSSLHRIECIAVDFTSDESCLVEESTMYDRSSFLPPHQRLWVGMWAYKGVSRPWCNISLVRPLVFGNAMGRNVFPIGRVFFLFVVAVQVVRGFPNPQTDSDGDGFTDFTEKCDRFKFQEYLSDVDQCDTQAKQPLNEVFASGSLDIKEINDAICSSIRGVVSERSPC